jgi:hypothetical protein
MAARSAIADIEMLQFCGFQKHAMFLTINFSFQETNLIDLLIFLFPINCFQENHNCFQDGVYLNQRKQKNSMTVEKLLWIRRIL